MMRFVKISDRICLNKSQPINPPLDPIKKSDIDSFFAEISRFSRIPKTIETPTDTHPS